MIGWEKELLTKTGLIMKKKATRGNMSGRKANGALEDALEDWQEARREGCNA